MRALFVGSMVLAVGLGCSGLTTKPPAPAPPSDPVEQGVEHGKAKAGKAAKARERGPDPIAGTACDSDAKPTCVGDSLAECTGGRWKLTPCDPYGCIPVGTPGFEGATQDGCGAD